MPGKKKLEDLENLPPLEKHPLEPPPAVPGDVIISEEDLDRIPDDSEEEELRKDEAPEPGEGP